LAKATTMAYASTTGEH